MPEGLLPFLIFLVIIVVRIMSRMGGKAPSRPARQPQKPPPWLAEFFEEPEEPEEPVERRVRLQEARPVSVKGRGRPAPKDVQQVADVTEEDVSRPEGDEPLLLPGIRGEIARGMVLTEILGPPLAMRKRRPGFPGR